MIESELIPAIESGISVLLFRIKTVKNQFSGSSHHIARIDKEPIYRLIDLLFFVCQKNIYLAVLLNQRLPGKSFQRIFYTLRQAHPVLIDIGGH